MTKRVKALQPRGKHFVREWRIFRALTQDKLAELMRTTSATVSRVEKNKIGYTQGFLEAAAEALRCRPEDLIIGPPSNSVEPVKIFASYPEHKQRAALRILNALSDDDIENFDKQANAPTTRVIGQVQSDFMKKN